MAQEEFDLLESVIHITKERNKKSIERSLVETLSEVLQCDAILLLRSPLPLDRVETLDVAASFPGMAYRQRREHLELCYGEPQVPKTPFNSECIASKTGIKVGEKGQQVIYPIVINEKVEGIIEIYDYVESDYLDRIVQSMIKIFSNFLSIVNDSERDALTGLFNRKTFDERFAELVSISTLTPASKENSPEDRRDQINHGSHWIAVLDIDHFKQVNDNYGHIYGDEVLLLFSDLMKNNFRSNDLLFRYGGEEFVVVLAPTTEENAIDVFNRFRAALEAFEFPQVGHITASIGFARVETGIHPSDLFGRADEALYYAKAHGRNQVQSYSYLLHTGALQAKQQTGKIELF